LDELGGDFDIIESIGVLHHMKEPMAGWRVLTDLLKTGGLMNIGLYSESARRHIVKARDDIALRGIGTSKSDNSGSI
jgi:2-polyprenyl-3-methyl-5-hydroxy-6-metoxy-1,4-benzoquinol methylase